MCTKTALFFRFPVRLGDFRQVMHPLREWDPEQNARRAFCPRALDVARGSSKVSGSLVTNSYEVYGKKCIWAAKEGPRAKCASCILLPGRQWLHADRLCANSTHVIVISTCFILSSCPIPVISSCPYSPYSVSNHGVTKWTVHSKVNIRIKYISTWKHIWVQWWHLGRIKLLMNYSRMQVEL